MVGHAPCHAWPEIIGLAQIGKSILRLLNNHTQFTPLYSRNSVYTLARSCRCQHGWRERERLQRILRKDKKAAAILQIQLVCGQKFLHQHSKS